MHDAARLSTIEILARLVAFDTTSRNSNLPLIAWIEGYLDEFGIASRLSYDPTGSKANLHAIIGPAVDGGLALSGHVDTVPVDGQAWSTDPFTLHVENGRAQARGAVDMKGFVASVLAAVPDLQALPLLRPVHLFISYNEEVDCEGARVLMQDIAEASPKPALCIVGEPSLLQPIIAHKGRLAVRATVTGHAGHSSQPSLGVNAIHAAAEAVAWIAAEGRRLEAHGRREAGFDPEHSTIHVGLIEGGRVLNIIPEHASFEMEWRTIPGDDALAELDRLRAHLRDTTERWMHAVDPATGIVLEPMDELPPLALDPDHELLGLVRQATGRNGDGKVSYGTEAGIYQDAGIASIVCGPGDIAQAHRPDEWVALSQLEACDAFIRQVAARLTSPRR